MSGDYSRFTDRPLRRYTGVRMQQGRVQLDADWNEEVALLKRRWETQAEDTFGPCAVPEATTPDGFKVSLKAPNDLALGEGRIYVHGHLAEIFPGETVGNDPVSYLHQPFLPDPPPLPGGNYVVYLDLWDREVTYIEDPDILEKALGGPDTATRIQTVWQVRTEGVQGDAECGTPLGEPSTGRLSTRAIAPPASDDPCILSPTGGYRGIENRLYRVEVHDSSGGTTRFKWSRENASVVSAVTGTDISGTESRLTVTRIGRDAVLRFQVDDWVEVLDDNRELNGLPGQMLRVKNVVEATRTLVLDGALSGFGANPAELAARHTRVRRWDQRNGLDADGLIAVTPGTWIALEDGVEVLFSPNAGTYHTGDYWSFAARTVDGSVEELKEAPPLGIYHFYCQLAAVNGKDVDDCRPLWPDCKCGCCCTVEVGNGKESHGDFNSLEEAVNALSKDKWKKGEDREWVPAVICLLPGTHRLSRTVVIERDSLTLRGCCRTAPVIGPDDSPAFRLQGNHLQIEKVFLSAQAPDDAAIFCEGTAVILDGNEIETPGAPAVLSWGVQGLWVLGNQMRHVPRQRTPSEPTEPEDVPIPRRVNFPQAMVAPNVDTEPGLILLESGTVGARVIGNLLGPGLSHGIALAVASQRDIVIAANEIRGMLGSGISSVASRALPEHDDKVFVEHLMLAAISLPSPGRIDGLRIEHNTITACVRTALKPRANGIPFGGIVLGRVDHTLISDNRIEDNGAETKVQVPVAGLYVRNARGLIVRDNVITGNGPEPDGNRIPGRQGGILAEELSVIVELEDITIPGTAGPPPVPIRPDGWPAASVQGNLVVAPRGQALLLTGMGPMQVLDNRLTARDVLGQLGQPGGNANVFSDFFGAVLILNAGLPAYIARQLLAAGFLSTQAPDLPEDYEQLIVSGKVEFSNNQVSLDLVRGEIEIAFAAVGILTLDDLSFHGNQTECTLFRDFLMTDALLFGLTVRANDNGLTESLFFTALSLWARGILQCIGAHNEATHCIRVECANPAQLINGPNLSLNCKDEFGSLSMSQQP